MRITQKQFDIIAKLIRARPETREAARRVLVEGQAQTDVAKAVSLSCQSVSQAVKRVTSAHQELLSVYSQSVQLPVLKLNI